MCQVSLVGVTVEIPVFPVSVRHPDVESLRRDTLKVREEIGELLGGDVFRSVVPDDHVVLGAVAWQVLSNVCVNLPGQ